MIIGKKYINDDVFYTVFKKHFCPQCGKQLQLIKKSKIVNSKSPEVKNFDFNLGDSFLVGDVKFIWREFRCLNCNRDISIAEMRRIESGIKNQST